MMGLLEELEPLRRMIISPGMDRAYEILEREMPSLVVHEYPSGSEAEDWVVPDSWAATEAILQDESGRTVASLEESHLFVPAFSEPVEGWFTKDELEPHVTTRPDRPDAFPFEHRHAYDYQLVDWGITLPHNRWVDLPDGRYFVKVEVERKAGAMKVGEAVLPGRRKETLCICAHVDELCNDDLSGCVVAVELMRHIASLSDRRYSYQLLLVPETIGSLFFVHSNRERVDETIGMLFLEAVGAGEEWCLKEALRPGSGVERMLRVAMESTEVPFRSIKFFEGYGNDERVYAWPTTRVPGISLMRFPFDQYHTSEDTPSIINEKHLLQALEFAKGLVALLEADCVPRYTGQLPPWLTRRGLYFDSTRSTEQFHKYNNQVLFNVDGTNTVLDLAEIAGLQPEFVSDYLERFVNEGLIETSDSEWSDR
jgi:aminopeptidase-like protein